jgi:hypothetical protein
MSRPFHRHERWMHTQATVLGLCSRQNVVSSRLEKEIRWRMEHAHRERCIHLRTSYIRHPLFNPTDFPTGTLANELLESHKFHVMNLGSKSCQ